MGIVLQRWRCPDCRSVYDVFVDEATGHAEEMKDELCPSCQHNGKLTLGGFDEVETALYNGDENPSPCAYGHLVYVGDRACSRCGEVLG